MMVVICAGRAAIPAPIGHGFDLAALSGRGQRELRRERCVEVVHQAFGVQGFADAQRNSSAIGSSTRMKLTGVCSVTRGPTMRASHDAAVAGCDLLR